LPLPPSVILTARWAVTPQAGRRYRALCISQRRSDPHQGACRGHTGRPDSANAAAVVEAIEIAVKACLAGEAAALVTAPIHKAVLHAAGFSFPGHTEFLAHLTGARRAVMMLASDKLRVVPLTIHMPIAEVPKAISKQAVFETGEIILTSLRRDFGILNPRLAVAGLNPHAGEDGILGAEDGSVIAPAIAALKARGFHVRGRCRPIRCSMTRRARVMTRRCVCITTRR